MSECELEKPVSFHTTVNNKKQLNTDILSRFSSSMELKRTIATCMRITHDIKTKTKTTGQLTINELKVASTKMFYLIQKDGFSNELKLLLSKRNLEGKLANLTPFIDTEGILRVGGRLDKADLPFFKKHPCLLPQNHHFTEVMIREEHLKVMHAGAQATLNSLQQNFWIVNGRSVVKREINKCVTCARAKPMTLQYIMGHLPKERLSFKRPFLVSVVDYCGPFFVKEKKHRNRNKVKVYAAIFVCFATRAVHIEIVSDLTPEAFLSALRRFFGRRGLSSDIFSDNATNFVGAKNEFIDIQNLLNSHDHNATVKQTLAIEHISWHVIPPRAPHFGGLWEAAVKSFKHHFLRVVGDTLLTYENLSTVFIEIEAILNSRPLTPISSDPNDLTALTPAHFLIGDSFKSMPERNLNDVPSWRLLPFQHIQQMRQHFWNRWHKEYLHGLNVRNKWLSGSNDNIKLGKLVTIKEENTPPMRWTLGRIIAVHPGSDNVIRVVTVKIHKGEYKRSVKNISPLPVEIDNLELS